MYKVVPEKVTFRQKKKNIESNAERNADEMGSSPRIGIGIGIGKIYPYRTLLLARFATGASQS
jgi:hypothetical protein